jgi:hypothetical protein
MTMLPPFATMQSTSSTAMRRFPKWVDYGLRIDIGVRDPSWPYGFLAGVECDSVTYHSGVTVRDRLHQEILKGVEWALSYLANGPVQ